MRALIIVFLVLFGAAYFYQTGQQRAARSVVNIDLSPYQCDGRIHCSQMTSCQEALYFLRNCPGTEMDGDGDKVPCEKEWCGHSISQSRNFK